MREREREDGGWIYMCFFALSPSAERRRLDEVLQIYDLA